MSLAGAKVCSAAEQKSVFGARRTNPTAFRTLRNRVYAAGSGFSKSAAADASASASASARLNKLRENSAALRELLQKRAEGVNVSNGKPAPVPSRANGANGTNGTNGTNGSTSMTASGAPSSSMEYSSTVTAARSMVPVTFWMKFHVDYGQRIVLVGSMPELGNWVLADGIDLAWSEGDMWNATVELPSTSVVEYKYVVVGQGGHAASWQSGNNSVLAIADSDEEVEVHDNWGGSPGAKVMSGGNLPVTREKKLLAWATELESSVVAQRQELRKLRMELVTAQEEARLAREEAKKLKMQLAKSEAEKTTNSKAVRDVEAVNNVLKEQIKETTRGFREALSAAVEILEAENGGKGKGKGKGKGASK